MIEEIFVEVKKSISIMQVEEIVGSKNKVYLITDCNGKKYILKMFSETFVGDIVNKEEVMYELLHTSQYIKPVISCGKQYILTEYIEGESVDKLLLKQPEKSTVNKIIKNIVDFINSCNEIKGIGVGAFTKELRGESISWDQYLLRYINNLHHINNKRNSLLNFLYNFLEKYIKDNRSYFQNIDSVIAPIDLNLKNFLINREGEVKCIDLDAVWLGDKLLSYGELLMHIYGTNLYIEFVREYGDFYKKNCQKIHFYSLFTTYSILTFLGNSGLEFEQICPWGNKCKFVELMKGHFYIVKNSRGIKVREILIDNDLIVNSGMGEKVLELNEHSYLPNEAQLCDFEKICGITRVADITYLDRIGIYAYQSVRPDAEEGDGSFTIFSGKGLTKEQCKISAIMEGIERYCAEERNNRDIILKKSIAELRTNYNIVEPKELNILNQSISENDEIEWILGYDLIAKSEVYIPAANVCYPYDFRKHKYPLRNYTTGLAAGNTYLEALFHGLCEVIERDAAAMNIIFKKGISVDIHTIKNKTIRKIIERITKTEGLKLYVKYITTEEINVPVFQVLIDDTFLRNPLYISGGYGAHPNKEIALINALNEAILSRAGTISGGREDLEKFLKAKENFSYEEYKEKYRYWFDQKKTINFENIESEDLPTILDDMSLCVERLVNAGFDKIIFVNLKKRNIDVPVIKMLVPGLERYSFKMEAFGRHAINHARKEGRYNV